MKLKLMKMSKGIRKVRRPVLELKHSRYVSKMGAEAQNAVAWSILVLTAILVALPILDIAQWEHTKIPSILISLTIGVVISYSAYRVLHRPFRSYKEIRALFWVIIGFIVCDWIFAGFPSNIGSIVAHIVSIDFPIFLFSYLLTSGVIYAIHQIYWSFVLSRGYNIKALVTEKILIDGKTLNEKEIENKIEEKLQEQLKNSLIRRLRKGKKVSNRK